MGLLFNRTNPIVSICLLFCHGYSTVEPGCFHVLPRPSISTRGPGYFHALVTKRVVKMQVFASLVCSVVIFQTFAAAASIPRLFERFPVTPRKLHSIKVQRELGSQISKTTVIFGPQDSRFSAATARWNDFAVPQIQLVIEPGQESDVSTIVSGMKGNLSTEVRLFS